MKKSVFFLVFFCCTSTLTWSQSGKVVVAYNYMSEGFFDKAQQAIDEAIEHEKTSVQSKTWLYRGKIYLGLHNSKKSEYRNLVSNPLEISIQSFIKAKELAEKGRMKNEIDEELKRASAFAMNKGVNEYNDLNFEKAMNAFKLSVNAAEALGQVDSLAYYNAALAADRGGFPENAVEDYRKCIEIGYGGPKIFSFVAALLRQLEQEDEAFKVVQEGRALYPDDHHLLIEETNSYLQNEDYEGAKNGLRKAIKNDSTNALLYFSLGSVYDNLRAYEDAEKQYLKALSLDPNYFDPNYNLGALYYNQGVDVTNTANTIKDQAKYEKELSAANVYFEKALPYLEKALEIQPDDDSTLKSLKNLYSRMGNREKYDEIKERLEN